MSDTSPENEFLGDVSDDAVPPPGFEDSVIGEPDTEPIADDIPPIDGEDVFAELGDGQCAVCGAPTFRPPGLTKTGRKKRVPKYCDLHSRDSKVSNGGPDAARMESQLRQIHQQLTDELGLLGVLLGPFMPVTGVYVTDGAERAVAAGLQLAKDKQRFMRIVYRAAQIAPIYTLGEYVAGIGVAVQVDQQKTDPHSTFSRHLGVERAYEAVYPQTVVNGNGNGTQNSSTMTPPPTYATVQ